MQPTKLEMLTIIFKGDSLIFLECIVLLSVAFLSFLVPVSGKNGAGVDLASHLVLGVREEKLYVSLRF